MQIIDQRAGRPRVVEFTDTERAIAEQRDTYMDVGYGVPQSCILALRWAKNVGHQLGRLDQDFLDYISDSTVVIVRGRPKLKESARWMVSGGNSKEVGISDLLLTCGLAMVLGLVMAVVGMVAPAQAAYGGCEEAWQAPQSKGAAACRERGWTVRARIVTTPRHVVRVHRLPSCANEDGSGTKAPCSWNLRAGDGNGHGSALWYDAADRAHYVWRRDPSYGPARFEWVDRRLSRKLARTEGRAPRWWRRCVVRYGDTTRIRCADGTRVTS